MKNLFTNNQLEGFMIFSHKRNWKAILSLLEETLDKNQFFFFFDSERGYHLKVFSPSIIKNQLDTISSYLVYLPVSETTVSEDPLFRNVPENTLHNIKYIPQTINITYPDNLASNEYVIFLNNLSSVVVDALRYNDFFVEEKNRINFAIQLIFMALVKANKEQIKKELVETLENTPNNIDNNSPLVNFYREVQQIESEEKIENWVINWLNVASDFLNKAPFHTLVESICTMLEIRNFAPQLLYTTKAVLQY
ncbi:hypothetical protein GCM10011514_09230 [Emticicia aquatilis]|uniref:Uncharacterized protein n=1 Tax=Emticicia aquatilis TaxID=1537369 RepID=A0A917DLN3_9BACT|nr:hypothetical protein [Emticicia aquatilis]GGD47395.1 hypothetical protein GCM10011514_09230 [Emticicia aquatilis]